MIIFPEESFHASERGLTTWWEIVFPTLLPFFITAELLLRFGVVQFIGVLFEPIMRPLFNVPGIGSFAWIVGMASGYPSGAKITAMLRDKKQISQLEAERLVAFSNASSPLFIFGAIAVGFFHQVELGILIAICHYAGNIFVGIFMRFYGEDRKINKQEKKQLNIVHRAFQRMHHTRIEKKQPIGDIIGESVTASIQTLLMVGGFIILFSVFTTILQIAQVAELIKFIISPLLQIIHFPDDIIPGFFTGIFEITMGTEMITKLDHIPVYIQLMVVTFILGFNGFSVQAQVASILSKTDIRFKPFFVGRMLHALISSLLCYVLFELFFKHQLTMTTILPAFLQEGENTTVFILEKLSIYGPIITISSIALATFIYYGRILKNKPL